jgi:proteasome assembly chaperone (PAC2) family protein
MQGSSFGLPGAGRIGKVHAKAICDDPQARPVAVAVTVHAWHLAMQAVPVSPASHARTARWSSSPFAAQRMDEIFRSWNIHSISVSLAACFHGTRNG